MFATYFHTLCNPVIFFNILLYLTWKLFRKMFKKVHENELNIWLESLSLQTESHVSFWVWKFMTVSLLINRVLCLNGNVFIVAYIFLILRIWAPWSDRPFILGDIEDQFSLLLSTKILSMAVLELFWILVEKFPVWNRLYVSNMRLGFYFLLLSIRKAVFMSPHIKNSAFSVYRCLKVSSKSLQKLIKISASAL